MPALVINKQYDNAIPPTSGQFDAAFNSIETFVNITGFGADNIADGSITGGKIVDASITETKLVTNVVGTTELSDLSITSSKLTPAALLLLLEPTGTVDAFGGDTVPAGYLLCDGTAIDRTVYADLFAVVGVRFGTGNGTSTFNIPDLRGRFLRGTDGGAGRDPEAATRTAMATGAASGNAVGSVQLDDWKFKSGITLARTSYYNSAVTGLTNMQTGAPGAYVNTVGYRNTAGNQMTNADGSKHGYETRPINASILWVIKI